MVRARLMLNRLRSVFMRCGTFKELLFVAAAAATIGSVHAASLDSLQQAYVDLRFGMFIHFGIETFNGGDYWNKNTPPSQSVWNPSALNCKNWADAAKAAKMKYGVLTTKHHYGFCLWNTSTTSYNCMNSGSLKTDVVKAYCDAFRADSLLPGFYYSMFDVFSGVDAGHESFSRTLWEGKKAFIKEQLRELLTNYGPIPILVIDGWAWRMGHNSIPYQEIREYVKSLQPNCLLCDHDGVSKPWDNDIVMFEEPKGVYCPPTNTFAATQGQIIISQPSGSWFWTGGGTSMTTASIRTHLANLEPRYCNFLLNCPPTAAGVLNQAMVDTLVKIGTLWSPDATRPPLPEQPYAIEHPVTPVGAMSAAGTAWNAIDGYNDVFSATSVGQSLWSAGAPPQEITIDLGAVYDNLDILGYLPRQDYVGGRRATTGNITSYIISVSDDNTSYRQVTTGTWAADSNYKIAEWSPAATGRYLRLKAAGSNGSSVVVGEISVGGRLQRPMTTTGTVSPDAANPVSKLALDITAIGFHGVYVRLVFNNAFTRDLPVEARLFTVSGVQVARLHGVLRTGERSLGFGALRNLLSDRVYLCSVSANKGVITRSVVVR
jgi:alpha-L-fucosidase